MRITTNTLSMQLIDQLDRLSSEQSRATQQMATGQRLTQPSDDVAATGRTMSYQSQMRQLQQYDQNAQIANTDLNISDTALNSLQGIAAQVYNIVPAAMSSNDPATLATYNAQLDGLLQQAFSLANTSTNGVYSFGASANIAARSAMSSFAKSKFLFACSFCRRASFKATS